MQRRPFGKTGLSVSPLGFGGAEIGFSDLEPVEIDDLLNTILDLGINVIDTAVAYDRSESLIGQSISRRRDEFVLISKCGRPYEESNAESWSPELIASSIDRSLKLLQTDYLDVMFLHSCPLDVLKQGEALGALVDACSAGKIRLVGYSGDSEAARFAAELSDVTVIETSVNICDQKNIDDLLPICMKNNIGVMAKRPIANAAWRPVDTLPDRYRDYVKPYAQRLRQMGLTPLDFGSDASHDQFWPEMALRFCLTQPGVHCAIVGTTNLQHLKANIAAVMNGPLGETSNNRLRTAFQKAEENADDRPWLGLT